mgnify:CR=1
KLAVFGKKMDILKIKLLNTISRGIYSIIKVRIDIFKHLSKSIPEKVINEARTNNDIMKIIIDKKYLFISSISKFTFEKDNLFMNIFLG